MRRELNEDEFDFVDSLLVSSGDSNKVGRKKNESVVLNSRNSVKAKAVRAGSTPKRVPFYKDATNWAGFFIVVPFIFAVLVLVLSVRVEAMLNSGELAWLLGQDMSDDALALLKSAGFDWLPGFLSVYNYRFFIIAGIFLLSFTFATLILCFSARKGRKLQNANNIVNTENQEEQNEKD